MPDQPASCLRAVEGRLEPGEDVWAVYPSARRALVATRRHLFLLDADGRVEVHELGEYRAVRRARGTCVSATGNPAIRFPRRSPASGLAEVTP